MKIKLDECIPNAVSIILQTAGHDVQTVHQERLSGSSDSVIWDAAQAERRFLITTDLDFSDIKEAYSRYASRNLAFSTGKRRSKRYYVSTRMDSATS